MQYGLDYFIERMSLFYMRDDSYDVEMTLAIRRIGHQVDRWSHRHGNASLSSEDEKVVIMWAAEACAIVMSGSDVKNRYNPFPF